MANMTQGATTNILGLGASTAWFERRWPGSFVWLGKGRYAANKRRIPVSQANVIAAEVGRRAH